MAMVTVQKGLQIVLPEKLRETFGEGDEIVITRNADGHFVLLTPQQFQDLLGESFGIWADRTDIPTDGVEYVNQIRNDGRFDEIRKLLQETP